MEKKSSPPAHSRQAIEASALRLSLMGYLGFGALGVVFAVVTGSDAILLDGVYSLICAAVAVGALQVCRLVTLPDDDSHPFGYAKYEPLLNALKGFLILALCLVAVGGSLASIIYDGGREPAFGWAVVYSVVATVGCAVVAFALKKSARATGSALLVVEARSWFFDAAISGAVGIAFVLALALTHSPFARWVPFIDPVMTLILILVLLPVPARTVAEAFRQLVFMRPQDAEHQRLRSICLDTLAALALPEPRLRSLRIGRTVYIMATFLLAEDQPDPPVEKLDQAREEIIRRITAEEIAPVVFVDIFATRRAEFL